MGLAEPTEPSVEPPLRPSRADVAVAVGLLAAAVLYVVACVAGGSYGTAFFSIPFFFSFAVGALFPRRPYLSAFSTLALALLLAIVTLVESVVCCCFALPVLVPMTALGAFTGATFVRYARSRRQRNGLIGGVLLVGAGWQAAAGMTDEPLRHPLHSATAKLSFDAPPDAVFAALTSKELRVASRWPWFLRIGLPMPERLTLERPGPGGELRFDFSQGTAFARITTWQPPHALSYRVTRYEIRDLPFHITRLGRTPDYGFRRERVQDWLTIEGMHYELVPLPDGKTELTRSIVWRRHLTPDFYFGWLQQAVIERGQVRLLELMRTEIERRQRVNPTGVERTAAL